MLPRSSLFTIIGVIAPLLLAAGAALAIGRTDAGTTGAQFLKVSVSPRVAALGEAYGALGDDVASILSNPAGMSYMSRKEAQFTHAQLVADIKLNSLFYGHPISEKLGTLAVNYALLDYGELQRTILQPSTSATPFIRSGTFDAQDQALSIGYADDLFWGSRKIRWGMTAKIIHMRIDDETANGLAYDAGLLYEPLGGRWKFGAVVQNLGFLSKFRDSSDPLPINLKFSGSGRLWRDKLKLGLDLNLPIDNSPVINTGVELNPIRQLSLRAGFRYDNSTTDYKGYSAGLGVNLSGVSLDYAYVPFELLGVNHRFSLSSKFGAPVPGRVSTADLEEAPAKKPVKAAKVAPPREQPRAEPEPEPEPEPMRTAAPPPPPQGVKALQIGEFVYRGGPEEHAWIADGTREVFRKHWMKQSLLHPDGIFKVMGSCQIADNVLYVEAVLRVNGTVLGNFEGSGDAGKPFLVWSKVLSAIDGRLASLGVQTGRVATSR